MIVRLVTMTFQEKHIPKFLEVFESFKPQIRNFNGCMDLKLIQNPENLLEISTLSQWQSIDHLNAYRKSELFGEVWPQTKKLFQDSPKAYSYSILSMSN